MKQHLSLVAAVAMTIPVVLAAQQTPPAPPAAPAPAAPATAPAPAQTPRVMIAPRALMPGDPLIIDSDEIRRAVEDAKWQGQLAADEARRISADAKWQGQLMAEDARRTRASRNNE